MEATYRNTRKLVIDTYLRARNGKMLDAHLRGNTLQYYARECILLKNHPLEVVHICIAEMNY